MGEIFACCDRVTVLRDGKFVATNEVKDIDEAALVEQMIGRRVVTPGGKAEGELNEANALQEAAGVGGEHPHAGKVVLSAKSITSPRKAP